MLVIEAVSLLSLNCIKKKLSFPRQSENWRGNLLVFCDFFVYPGDCHTRDIGHWFAMTVFFVLFAQSKVLVRQPHFCVFK